VPEYRIYLNDELLCCTDWPPMAQAAWNRAARDRDAAQHGGQAILLKDGVGLARVRPQILHGHPWPDTAVPECELRDVLKAVLIVLRHAGVDAVALADSATAAGLPTTRARIDALRGTTPGKRTAVCAAEVMALLYAAIPLLKSRGTAEKVAKKYQLRPATATTTAE
jgi:hypothetical protein